MRALPRVLSLAILLKANVAGAGAELPIFTLVRIDVGRDTVIATEDVSLGHDPSNPRDSDLFFAFGAPGAPRALDATLRFEGPNGIVEEPLTWALATRSNRLAIVASGPKEEAGVHVHLPDAAMRRATRIRRRFVVRFRAIHPLPAKDDAGLREMRVRVTPSAGDPPALFRIEVLAQPGAPSVDRSLAFFCSKPKEPIATAEQRLFRAASPLLVPRAPGESLCIQFAQREDNAKK